MKEYHKIQTVYLRDPETKFRTLLEGEFALPEFDYLQNNMWVWTEKVDGTNIRVHWNGSEVRFGGRTEHAQIPVHLLNVLQDLFPPDIFPECFPDEGHYTLYGEGYGAKIQKGGGRYKPDGCDFILFDVRAGEWWLKRDAVEDVAAKLGLRTVPVVGVGTLEDAVQHACEGFCSHIAEDETFPAEGLVMRPAVELKNRAGHRIVAKIKTKDF